MKAERLTTGVFPTLTCVQNWTRLPATGTEDIQSTNFP